MYFFFFRYSQVILGGKPIPPPPSSPLPPAPGENIYAELGEKPAALTVSGYLEPLKTKEDSTNKSAMDNKGYENKEQYEKLDEQIKAYEYQKLHGGQAKIEKEDDTIKDNQSQTPSDLLERKSTKRSVTRSDEDDDGYLKLT